MKNYPRHRATSPRYIFKDTYEEILSYAKRKFSHLSSTYAFDGEFYIFKTEYQGSTSYSAESIDVYGNAFEHWVKPQGGRWQKQ
jgi:hypothetical protein